VIMTKR
jgi:hypothetical protein